MPADELPRLLIVDDHESNRAVAERILTPDGYRVTTAPDAESARRLIESEGPFDLYVLDVMMPGISGIELAEWILTTDEQARVLYFTAFSYTLFRSRRVLSEREAFVEKPVSNRDLREAVSLALFGHTRGPTGGMSE